VIVHKHDGGICMAVDYREVNMQFDYGKSVALSSDITSKIGWFYEKVDNL